MEIFVLLIYNLQDHNTNGVSNDAKLFSGCINRKPAGKVQNDESTRDDVEN